MNPEGPLKCYREIARRPDYREGEDAEKPIEYLDAWYPGIGQKSSRVRSREEVREEPSVSKAAASKLALGVHKSLAEAGEKLGWRFEKTRVDEEGKEVTGYEEGDVECKQCQFTFKSTAACKAHIELHLGKGFGCPHCSKVFASNYTRQNHAKSQHPEKYLEPLEPIECPVCSKKYATKASFKNHELVHVELDNKVCEFCEANLSAEEVANLTGYAHQKAYNDHAFDCRFNPKYKGPYYCKYKYPDSDAYACPRTKKFARRQVMKAHVRAHQKATG